MTDRTWPSEWLRGVLEVCVLRVLADGPTYGYAIATRLEESGLGSVKGGTLYPLLSRLEASGLVTVEWLPGEAGPGRKYFALTAGGHAELLSQSGLWVEFADLTKSLVTVAPVGSPPAGSDQVGSNQVGSDQGPSAAAVTARIIPPPGIPAPSNGEPR